jgi:catechol 2,3-dioxygenase
VTTGVTIGHIHLQVTNLQSAEQFYHATLGFDVTQRTFPGALFLAAGGYHHHIGLNVWNTRGGSPVAEQSSGLVRFGIRTGTSSAVQAIGDRLQETSYRFTKTERGILVRDTDDIQVEII